MREVLGQIKRIWSHFLLKILNQSLQRTNHLIKVDLVDNLEIKLEHGSQGRFEYVVGGLVAKGKLNSNSGFYLDRQAIIILHAAT